MATESTTQRVGERVMPWYTTDDARRDAEKQAAAKIDPLQSPGVQGLAQLGRNAIDRTSSLDRTIATLKMRLRRAGQLLIEEIGAGGPENADDTAERAAGVIRKQADTIAALSSQLGNLLAVIHRDGGHYESEHGTEKAVTDAMQRICDTRAGLVGLSICKDRDQCQRYIHRSSGCVFAQGMREAGNPCEFLILLDIDRESVDGR